MQYKPISTYMIAAALMAVVLVATGIAKANTLNGTADNQTDAYGYYYAVTGGKFPTGTTPNGDNGSGGTFRYLVDDPSWGKPIDAWQKDDWFADNAGLALTMKSGASTVYDNNGIEDGTYGDYYDAHGSHGLDGLYRGYSMSNNFDWIYAGYFKLAAATTIDTITGYFDGNGGATDAVAFNPNSPNIAYRMNIWSNVAGDLLPVNTNSFNGDVFSSDATAGAFSVSFTGVNRIMPDSSTDPIWRVSYKLSAPITLQAGEYWFSHDASVVPLPAAAWMGISLIGGLGGVRGIKNRLRRQTA